MDNKLLLTNLNKCFICIIYIYIIKTAKIPGRKGNVSRWPQQNEIYHVFQNYQKEKTDIE